MDKTWDCNRPLCVAGLCSGLRDQSGGIKPRLQWLQCALGSWLDLTNGVPLSSTQEVGRCSCASGSWLEE